MSRYWTNQVKLVTEIRQNKYISCFVLDNNLLKVFVLKRYLIFPGCKCVRKSLVMMLLNLGLLLSTSLSTGVQWFCSVKY